MPVNDWIAAGRAGAQGLSDAHGVIRDNSPKYGETYRTNMNARASERIAQLRAREKVLSAGIKANIIEKKSENAAKVIDRDTDRKVSGFRKAGILGALGGAAGGALTGYMTKQEEKRLDERDAKREAADLARLERYRSLIQPISSGTLTALPELIPIPPMPEPKTPQSVSSSDTSVQTVSPSISAQVGANPQGAMSKGDIRQLAINTGFTPEQADIVVGIAGGESGYDPTNSTRRSGLFDKTGEDSVGLMQVNWGYHKDSGWLQKLGITKREDLYDPVKNMKASKYLFDGRGNFGDWTVYNKGIYKDWL